MMPPDNPKRKPRMRKLRLRKVNAKVIELVTSGAMIWMLEFVY